jgi:hypothetical protein
MSPPQGGGGPDHYCERLEHVPKRHRGARQGKRYSDCGEEAPHLPIGCRSPSLGIEPISCSHASRTGKEGRSDSSRLRVFAVSPRVRTR